MVWRVFLPAEASLSVLQDYLRILHGKKSNLRLKASGERREGGGREEGERRERGGRKRRERGGSEKERTGD